VGLLPRYLLPAIPFAIGSILLLAAALRTERVALVLVVSACLFSAVNHGGRFYAREYTSFSTVERSHAYRDFLALQVEAIRRLAAKPPAMAAFVSKEINYMISSRMMGYVEEPIANTQAIPLRPRKPPTLDQLPEEFILLQTNRYHGGEEMNRLLAAARASGDYDVAPERFERAGFRATLYRVRRVGTGTP
jgi:hypothetical protein